MPHSNLQQVWPDMVDLTPEQHAAFAEMAATCLMSHDPVTFALCLNEATAVAS